MAMAMAKKQLLHRMVRNRPEKNETEGASDDSTPLKDNRPPLTELRMPGEQLMASKVLSLEN